MAGRPARKGRSYRCQARVRLIPKPGLPHMMVVETIGRGCEVSARSAWRDEDLARDVAFEAAHDFALGLAFCGAALDVGAGALAVAKPADGDQVKRPVGLAVAAVVEAVAGRLARGGRDRAGAAEHRERALAAESLDVLPGGDEQLAGVAGRDAEQLDRAWCGGRDELLELAVQGGDLLIKRLDPLSGRPQRELRSLRRGPELPARRAESSADGDLAAQRLAVRELIAQLLRGGDDQVAELDQRGAARLHGAVASDAQQPDRLDDPVGLLGDRLGLAGLEQAGGHLGVDRVALADTTAGVRVRLVDLDDRDVVLA